ncbi:MAG: MBOAT family protein [Lachnospiraceae bacterium]|nr:MBOAT family protein [Lachnospiraceae bacterium]
MLFNSFQFLIFFPIVTLIYFIIPKKFKYLWLLASSYYFYMCWEPRYILLILFSTVATYLCALLLEKEKKGKAELKNKIIIGVCIVVNIGILTIFKYAGFILASFSSLLGLAGISMEPKQINLLLPVGISFYTFQALGYIIDVYRKKVSAEHNFFKYALFVSFFPQLVAGPIERSKNLLADIEDIPKKKLLDYDRITGGLMLMLYGMFLKLVIADRICLPADYIFNDPSAMGSLELIIGALCFTIQIYCDFAGYSTIAIGAAKVMGFTLMENFDTPYFALSIRDFWRRWHISLSTWFRDYLYIPLGGSRCSRTRKYLNLMITFLVSGLWHGAGWHFVAWGGLHGAYQVIGDMTDSLRDRLCNKLRIKRVGIFVSLIRRFITFLLVAYAWVFFRADSLKNALTITKRMITGGESANGLAGLINIDLCGMNELEWCILSGAFLMMLIFSLVRYLKKKTPDAFLSDCRLPVKWLILYILIFAILIFGKYGPGYSQQAFIYFQF